MNPPIKIDGEDKYRTSPFPIQAAIAGDIDIL